MKFLITSFLLTHVIPFYGQVFKTSVICDKLAKIDSIEYLSMRVKGKQFPRSLTFKKTKGAIKIPTTVGTIAFRDIQNQHAPGLTYHVKGADTAKKWVLIEREDVQESIYFLVSTQTGHIDTLIGEPKIYGDKIICLESEYTDDPWRVEIWQIQGNKLIPLRKFSLAECDIHAVKSVFLAQKTLYITNHPGGCWKAVILD